MELKYFVAEIQERFLGGHPWFRETPCTDIVVPTTNTNRFVQFHRHFFWLRSGLGHPLKSCGSLYAQYFFSFFCIDRRYTVIGRVSCWCSCYVNVSRPVHRQYSYRLVIVRDYLTFGGQNSLSNFWIIDVPRRTRTVKFLTIRNVPCTLASAMCTCSLVKPVTLSFCLVALCSLFFWGGLNSTGWLTPVLLQQVWCGASVEDSIQKIFTQWVQPNINCYLVVAFDEQGYLMNIVKDPIFCVQGNIRFLFLL